MNMNDFELYTYLSKTQNNETVNIFFAHANGIPALTYHNLFEKLSKQLNTNIFSYDLRGIGKTKLKEKMDPDFWSWQHLIDDHIFLFEELKKKHPGRWILVGHSLGAWLSLLSSEKLGILDVWLLDAPILLPMTVLKWMTAIILKLKHLTPNGQKARRRTTQYVSFDAAYTRLKKTNFMKNWSDETIYHYLEGSFEQKENSIKLRHNPEWEAHLFEQYPPAASIGFLKLSRSYRNKLKPVFFVGEKSDTCNSKSKLWVKLFFPKLKWVCIPNGTHMFPLELQELVIQQVSQFIRIY